MPPQSRERNDCCTVRAYVRARTVDLTKHNENTHSVRCNLLIVTLKSADYCINNFGTGEALCKFQDITF